MTDTANIAEPARTKRTPRRGWWIAAVGVALLAVGAVIAVPSFMQNLTYQEAVSGLSGSEASIDQARTAVIEAQKELHAASVGAIDEYAEAGEFTATARGELLADITPLDSVKIAREQLFEHAGLLVDGAGVVTAPPAPAEPEQVVATTPTNLEGIREQTESNEQVAAELENTAAALREATDRIDELEAEIDNLIGEVLDQAAAFGADVAAFPKASPDSLAQLAEAVATLRSAHPSNPVQRFTSYASAFDAVAQSHAAAIATEQAKAESDAAAAAQKAVDELEALKNTPAPTAP